MGLEWVISTYGSANFLPQRTAEEVIHLEFTEPSSPLQRQGKGV